MTATGTCPRCRVDCLLRDGYIGQHEGVERRRDIIGLVGRGGSSVTYSRERCPGAGQRPLEFTAAARATRDRRLAAQVAAARDQAGVTLDAWLAKHGGTAHGESIDKALLEVPKLLKLAAKLGVLTHHATSVGARSQTQQSMWLRRAARYWQNPWQRRSREQGQVGKHRSADFYCTFCGELLRTIKGAALLTSEQLDLTFAPHTTPCALACLAGLRTPVAPGTKRLPSDVRQEEQGV